MTKDDKRYEAYVAILREELVPAMGCTEPIAIAYAAARAREILGELPRKVRIEVSGNIIKNVKSVIVPNTGHMRGIETAAAAGIVAGKAERKLEVISEVSDSEERQIKEFVKSHEIQVIHAQVPHIFYIQVILTGAADEVKLRIVNEHTNIVYIEKNGEILEEKMVSAEDGDAASGRECLNIKDIIDFAETVEIEDIRDVIGRQMEYNSAIAEEGMTGDYGANIGKVLLNTYGSDIKNRARAMAAAGSDARMNGCELPVVIVSGSGNQGIAASVPVIEYAKELRADVEKTMRAVVLSDLVTLHQKTGIGRLSAYCGAVSAGIGSGAGITYLMGGGYEEIAHTIVNALAIVSGVVCDGAKASCAAKIAAAVDAGIIGLYMYQNHQQFLDGEGIVAKGVEATITNVGRLAREGMKETDKEIIRIMVSESGM